MVTFVEDLCTGLLGAKVHTRSFWGGLPVYLSDIRTLSMLDTKRFPDWEILGLRKAFRCGHGEPSKAI